jgi:uncharacterized protein involved in exopolysaccharide biosynthesis
LIMNTQLKFDPHGRPNFQVERSDLRSHYELIAWQTLFSIWRHWRLILSVVAIALVLAGAVIPLMPRKYSAEALIYPNLFAQGAKVAPLASVDAAAFVTGEARLLRSDAILGAVVKRLGMDRDAAQPSWTSQGVDLVKAWLFPEKRKYSQFDRSVALLRDKVAIMNDTRSYLISLTFAASSPDEAAQVVNAFAIEYLRDKVVQRRGEIVNAAENELARQRAIYGDKHPKVLQAADGLDAARASLKDAMSPQEGGHDDVATDESVKLAVPNRTPTSPKGIVILGLSFLLALVAGIAMAVWRDHRDAKRKHGVVHRQAHSQ